VSQGRSIEHGLSDARQRRQQRVVTIGTALAVGAATTVMWMTVTWAAAWQHGYEPSGTWAWAHWDSGWYRFIAQHGYYLERCNGVPNRGPSDYCGSAGWFPLYPFTLRALGFTGIGVNTLGRWVAVAAMTATYAGLWQGFLRRHPLNKQILALVLAAAFPAGVYYGAMFPVSIVTASAIACLYALQREKFLLAGLCAVLAASAYPSGVLIPVAAALIPFATRRLGTWPVRLRYSSLVAVPGVLTFALVMANLRRTTGRWDAWFRIQEAYNYEATFPLKTISNQLESIIDGITPNAIGVQTGFVVILVVVSAVIARQHWKDLGLGERAVVPVAAALWLSPLTLGGELSLYRAESLLLPVIILLVRSRAGVLAALVVAAVPLSYLMATLFFQNVLI